MRRLSFALAFVIAAVAAPPLRAQEWGDWRPCDGPCRPWADPDPGWAGGARWRFGVTQGFAPGSWWNARAVRWRRFAARRNGYEAQAEGGATPRFGGWVWHRPAPTVAVHLAGPPAPTAGAARPVAHRADEAVAAMPTGALRRLHRSPAPVPSRVLAAAAMFRREAAPALPVVRTALPPSREAPPPLPPPREAAPSPRPPSHEAEAPPPRRPRGVSVPRRPAVQPAALRNEPATVQPAAAEARVPQVQPPNSSPAAPAADVPAAPLD